MEANAKCQKRIFNIALMLNTLQSMQTRRVLFKLSWQWKRTLNVRNIYFLCIQIWRVTLHKFITEILNSNHIMARISTTGEFSQTRNQFKHTSIIAYLVDRNKNVWCLYLYCFHGHRYYENKNIVFFLNYVWRLLLFLRRIKLPFFADDVNILCNFEDEKCPPLQQDGYNKWKIFKAWDHTTGTREDINWR